MKKRNIMYLAPIDAVWPPLLLMVLSASIGLLASWLGFYWLGILAILGVAILIGDLFGRSQDYLNAKRRLAQAQNHEAVTEVARRFRRAWCARVACQAAWKRVHNTHGLSEHWVGNVYQAIGYRWWHITPDGTFTKHSPFLKLAFWVHLFTGKMKRDVEEKEAIPLEAAE